MTTTPTTVQTYTPDPRTVALGCSVGLTCFAYRAGDPMLSRYVQMNNAQAFAIWTDGPRTYRVAMVGADGCGFPTTTPIRTKRAAVELARAAAAHCDLPYVGLV